MSIEHNVINTGKASPSLNYIAILLKNILIVKNYENYKRNKITLHGKVLWKHKRE